jgi:hypothetical protein
MQISLAGIGGARASLSLREWGGVPLSPSATVWPSGGG